MQWKSAEEESLAPSAQYRWKAFYKWQQNLRIQGGRDLIFSESTKPALDIAELKMSVLQQQYSSGKISWQSIWIRMFHVLWSFDIDLETFWWSFRWWWIASMHFSWLVKPSNTICRERKLTIWNLSIFRTLRSSKFSLDFQSSDFRQRCSREDPGTLPDGCVKQIPFSSVNTLWLKLLRELVTISRFVSSSPSAWWNSWYWKRAAAQNDYRYFFPENG